jgi:hypothetical protein
MKTKKGDNQKQIPEIIPDFHDLLGGDNVMFKF